MPLSWRNRREWSTAELIHKHDESLSTLSNIPETMNIRKTVRLGCLRRRWHMGLALLVCGLWLAMLPAVPKAGAGLPLTQTNNQFPDTDKTGQLSEATRQRAEVLLSRPELSAYRGWIKYLRFQAEREISRASVTNDLPRTNLVRFADWVRRIEANPGVLGTLRGVQEWAYESPADDSGQPFTVNIPTDYKPSRAAGLLVNLHGAMGDHHQWMAPHTRGCLNWQCWDGRVAPATRGWPRRTCCRPSSMWKPIGALTRTAST